MRRRQVLTAVAGATTAAVAGCQTTGSGGRKQHPFAGATVTVRVDDETTSDHDVVANARQALGFWERHSRQYAGFDVTFEMVAGDAPDVVLAYADDASACEDVPGFDNRVRGCAPVLGPETSVPDPVVANVAAARPFGAVLTTAKHEVGHILGLEHDDDPQAVMSNRPEDRIPHHGPRTAVFETTLEARERAATAGGRFADGVEQWNDERYTSARTAFEAADSGFENARGEAEAAREAFEAAVTETDGFENEAEVRTVDTDYVRAALDRAVERADTAATLSATMGRAAGAAGDGRRETARRRRQEADEHAAQFQTLDPVGVRALARGLGLVRETEGTPIVVPVDVGSS